MIRIGFIDDGILPVLQNISLKQYYVENSQVKHLDADINLLEHSHATTCMAIFCKEIGREIQEVEVVSIRVLDNTGHGRVEDVIVAIDWAVENDIKVINLSLGGTHFSQLDIYEPHIRKAEYKNIIIVAAQSNEDVFTYPASLSNVIGVKAHKCSQSEICLNKTFPFDGIEFCANSSFELSIYSPNGHKTDISNSFAAPVITALVAQICLLDTSMNVFEIKRKICQYLQLDYDFIRPFSAQKYQILNPYFGGNETCDIPIIKSLVSDSLNKNLHLKLLYDITALLKKEGYNCKVLTNIDVGVLYGFEIYDRILKMSIIANHVKYQKIDILFIATYEEYEWIEKIEFDMVLKMNSYNLSAEDWVFRIKKNYE